MSSRTTGVAWLCLSLLAVGTAVAAESNTVAEVKKTSWVDAITLRGDVRVRNDYIDKDGSPSRNRELFRARLTADAKINDEVKGVIGISSGNDNPVGSNLTMTDEFGRKALRLELAYVEWTPKAVNDLGIGALTLDGGKMKNPFITVSELIWDPDVNPEGFAAGYKLPVVDKTLDLLVNGGAMWYMERASDSETMLYTGQGGLKWHNADGYSALIGSSYYYFNNVAGYGAFDYDAKDNFNGNTKDKVVSGGKTNYVYASEFHELEFLAELGFPIPGSVDFMKKGKLYADYVNNLDPSDNNIGYQLGIQLGELKDKNDVMVSYAYRKLEADATMGAMTDSDWWNGGTDGKGHQVKAGYQMLKNWSIAGTYYFSNEIGISKDSPTDYSRAQVEVLAKF